MRFTEFAFSPALQAGIAAREHITPTPIQERVIQAVLDGRDVLGNAQTGSGKTAAYALPLLDRIAANDGLHTLIVVPTRELAYQVEEDIAAYAQQMSVRAAVIVGGASMTDQVNRLRNGAQVVIGTPGRLLDLIRRRRLFLDEVQALVLDEVDRMLDMGFLPDVQQLVSYLPGHRQSLFFSATMPDQIRPLANRLLQNPVEATVDPPSSTVATVTQSVLMIADSNKLPALMRALSAPDASRVLIFARTKRDTDDLHRALKARNIPNVALHGDLALPDRLRALDAFKDGEARILVATDIAARGLDIPDVSHVINYDVPGTAEDYVHRIGRTARAQKNGAAISLVVVQDLPIMKLIERTLKIKMQWSWAPTATTPAEEILPIARRA
ncbi:MAG TPA: DEAD/DEAH box helicase [Chloroflexia bacterium]|nr:DEAD/DEAH box helicase [Chloroflexia bacterium]